MDLKAQSKKITNRWSWTRSTRNTVGHITEYAPDFGWKEAVRLGIKDRDGATGIEDLSWPGLASTVRLRMGSTDLRMFQHVVAQDGYEFPFLVGTSPTVIVDAGANVGFASVWYANRYPDATILAIEPSSNNFAALTRNVRPYPNVIPIQGALWGERTTLKLTDPNDGEASYRVDSPEEFTPIATSEVDAYDVPSLMESFDIDHIDILKVDIEGSEKEVFQTSAPWIDKVGLIAIELHDRFKDGCTEVFERATVDFKQRAVRGEDTFVAR